MSPTSSPPTTTVADHFQFGDSTVLVAIRDGLGSIEEFALTQSQTPAEALRSIANGIQEFIELAEEDRITCLDIRPPIGGATYRASNITGVPAKNLEIMDYTEALADIRDELIARAA